eukprot:m.247563 g.247563  ORF g.247563 m.247563 type:complete len:836 (+) comp15862_c1_seq1:155-2662(+)
MFSPGKGSLQRWCARTLVAVAVVWAICAIRLALTAWPEHTAENRHLQPGGHNIAQVSAHIAAREPAQRPKKGNPPAFQAFLSRIFPPESAARIQFVQIDKPSFYMMSVVGDELHIIADGVLSACSAVNHYCRETGLCSVSWGQTRKPSLPSPLPQHRDVETNGVVTRHRWVPHSYNMNFCTHSYTMAWWGWPEWEKELDWMALHGVTMPLIALGREVVFRRLYREFGMTDAEILSFFTGPAFLAWHRMGNLKTFAGPLPPSYLEHSEQLTKRILKRARELGMTPVLPGFSGHVPNELKERADAPSESFSELPTWSGFSRKHSGLAFVEPTSELYLTLGKRFIEIQTELFGTDHLYAVDQFNENDPRSNDATYLEQCGQAQMNSLLRGDPKAVWVLQGWLFVFHSRFWQAEKIDAYIGKIPASNILILDLISEATPAYEMTRSFHGKPWVFNTLHNFGGAVGIRGNLPTVMSRPYAARAMLQSTMAGIGITMEGINQNPVMYEMTLSHAWEPAPRPLTQWVTQWAAARYGPEWSAQRPAVEKTWGLLLGSAYTVLDPSQGNGYWGVARSVIAKFPSLAVRAVVNDGFGGTQLKYNACEFAEAWATLAEAVRCEIKRRPEAAATLTGSLLELDLVDLTRQALSNHAEVVYLRFAVVAANPTQADAVASSGRLRDEFLELLNDLDTLLLTLEHFSFGRWERSAQALANQNDRDERALYAFNARNLVTLWGPSGQIQDYSARLWGGLIKSYYAHRWGLALNATVDWLRNPTGSPEAAFQSQIREFSQAWQHRPPGEGYTYSASAPPVREYPDPRSAVAVALDLHTKYNARARESCSEAQ